ncbi:MAG: spore cortex biosynthesis protein YabQ [Anaerovoracaceae bacterium]|jgi:hypothetical protein
MSQLIIQQAKELTVMICCGILLGLLYQILGTYQRIFVKSSIILWIQDIIFWIGAGIITASFFYYVSYGRVSFHGILGIIVGAVLWFNLFSQTLHILFLHICDIIKRWGLIFKCRDSKNDEE